MKYITFSRHNYTILIDDEDYHLIEGKVFHPNKTKTGAVYIKVSEPGCHSKRSYIHRLVLGVKDRKIYVDHRDGNPLNNQKSNLRLCTPSQNSMNRSHTILNSHKLKGVWKNGPNRWSVYIRVEGKKYYGGIFKDPNAAAMRYNEMARQYHGEFAYQNPITI